MKINNKAFTLVELLVVVLIIGILAAIALPQYQIAIAKSRLSTLKEVVGNIKNAQEIFYLQHGNYTTELNELDISLPGYLGKDDNGWYVFHWGKCGISLTSSSCIITGAFSFQKYYLNVSTSNVNRTNCLAVESNEAANKVCKMDTQTDTPIWTGNSIGYRWNAYKYKDE